MKLSEAEEKLLGIIRLKADATLTQLAEESGLRRHKVRYALDGLLRKGLLRRRIVIDPMRAGLTIFGFWLSLSSRGRAWRSSLIKWLIACPCVSYLGEFHGEYEFKADILARSAEEAEAVLAELAQRFGGVFAGTALVLTLRTLEYPLKGITARMTAGECGIGGAGERFILDPSDVALLHALANSATASHPGLAQALKMPNATFEYRLKRLRERNIIVAYQYWSPTDELAAAGFSSLVHRLQLTSSITRSRTALETLARAERCVYSVTFCLGSWQAEICTVSRSRGETETFVERMESLLGEDLLVRSSVPIINHHKVNGFPKLFF